MTSSFVVVVQAQHEQNKMIQFGENIFRNMEPSFWLPVVIVVLVSEISKIQRKSGAVKATLVVVVVVMVGGGVACDAYGKMGIFRRTLEILR